MTIKELEALRLYLVTMRVIVPPALMTPHNKVIASIDLKIHNAKLGVSVVHVKKVAP